MATQKMIRALFFAAIPVLAAALSNFAQAAELPPLDATVSYYSKSINHAGVTETQHYRNLLIRRKDHVWLERIVPQGKTVVPTRDPAAGRSGHKHVDFETSAQHLSRIVNGAIRADYIDRGQLQIVFVPPTEYSVSGFDGSWDNAASMVAEKIVKAMPLSKRATAVANSEWREEQNNGWYNRVLWSNTLKVALVVESGKTDGSVTRKTELEVRPLTPDSALPWKQLTLYAQKEYDDFMD